MLRNNEFILGDPGYIGEAKVITPLRPTQIYSVSDGNLNRLLNHYRVIVENLNSRIKSWHCLTCPWRHSLDLHAVVFWLICQIVNVDIVFRPIRDYK
jgi:hypothetical protein